MPVTGTLKPIQSRLREVSLTPGYRFKRKPLLNRIKRGSCLREVSLARHTPLLNRSHHCTGTRYTYSYLEPGGTRTTALLLYSFCCTSRALSLRNLVSGYECGRVFPAGVGPGSLSRDAVNWLPSRFSLSVETRRRFGWLRMMVFPGAHLFRAPIWCLREGGGTREAGSTAAESPVVLYQVGTHQIRRRRRAARSSTSQGRAEPLCARITGLNREVSEGKADV